MLQKLPSSDQSDYDDQNSFLTPEYLLGALKRRWWLFAIPFIFVAGIGALITFLLPAVYYAEGKVLVESQQIPTDLVRPTVAALANERIQIIEQRIMTRDKLLDIANKFQLFAGSRWRLSDTERLDFLRDRTQIKPLELKIPARPADRRQAIAFTIGFEHENPQVAMRVANEFVTLILAEDVRTRTNFASETTRFLEREAKRLEGELNSVETQIAELKSRPSRAPGDVADKQLLALRSELLQKSAVYSDSHPDMKALKQKIAALEKLITPATDASFGLESLERMQASIRKNLETANQKLSVARLGESLERGQQSERLEIIEQPSLPQKPVRPSRIKVLALVLALAVGVGGAAALGMEMLDRTIYRTADVLRLVDGHLVVTVPYITTKAEAVRRKGKIVAWIAVVTLAVAGSVAAAVYFMPQLLPKLQILMDDALLTLRIR